ncbi:nuclear transport factor 2 family protein [Paenarthrobacter sp. OM7]|uniref:nuclear transport factor 2 family protein n=2 Tax=Paenarthrobacter TaxID=1742992 RepID=UPI00246982AC|nr:nuclear transport factor 2 family protein [Paenarthrobacter sp. OM7]WGM21501.1 nuclear transport factor 2 family protein [Paenarthrobacter sp. OM7]
MTTPDNAGRTMDAAEDELLDAMRASDLEALDRLISDDLKFIDPEGTVLTKKADLEAHRTGATNFARIEETNRRTLESDGSGTTDTTARAVLHINGSQIEIQLLWHREWRIIDGRWQVLAGSVVVLD